MLHAACCMLLAARMGRWLTVEDDPARQQLGAMVTYGTDAAGVVVLVEGPDLVHDGHHRHRAQRGDSIRQDALGALLAQPLRRVGVCHLVQLVERWAGKERGGGATLHHLLHHLRHPRRHAAHATHAAAHASAHAADKGECGARRPSHAHLLSHHLLHDLKGVLVAKELAEDLLRLLLREAAAAAARALQALLAERVVRLPLLLVGQHLVGLAHNLEVGLGDLRLVGILVRVILDGQLLVRCESRGEASRGVIRGAQQEGRKTILTTGDLLKKAAHPC